MAGKKFARDGGVREDMDLPAPHISVRRLLFVAESSAVMNRALRPS